LLNYQLPGDIAGCEIFKHYPCIVDVSRYRPVIYTFRLLQLFQTFTVDQLLVFFAFFVLKCFVCNNVLMLMNHVSVQLWY